MHNEGDKKIVWEKVRKNPIFFPTQEIHKYYGNAVLFFIFNINICNHHQLLKQTFLNIIKNDIL